MPPAAKNGMADAMPFFLRREPLRWVLVGKKRSSLQRTHCTPKAPNAHVCEPSGIFSAVHVARENDWVLLRPRTQTLRGFVTLRSFSVVRLRRLDRGYGRRRGFMTSQIPQSAKKPACIARGLISQERRSDLT